MQQGKNTKHGYQCENGALHHAHRTGIHALEWLYENGAAKQACAAKQNG